MCPLFDVDQFAPLSLFDGEQCSSICSSICTTGTGTGTTGTTRPFVPCSLLSSPQSAQLMNVAGPIPVTRVSNGQGGWADLILTKDKRPPSLCRQCTAVVFLGLTNTCCNRNGWTSIDYPHSSTMAMWMYQINCWLLCNFLGIFRAFEHEKWQVSWNW